MDDYDYNAALYYANHNSSTDLRIEDDEQLARDIQMALDLQEQEERTAQLQRRRHAEDSESMMIGQSGFTVQGLNRLDHMLFITAEVEGRLVEMLIDSGASASCVSFAMVDFLGLTRYYNPNVRGEATGAGKARIVGVLENVQCQIGHVEFRLFFLVLDTQRPYLILGLDQLKRFKCVIDLDANHLLFGGRDGVSTPFLDQDLAAAAAERPLPTMMTRANVFNNPDNTLVETATATQATATATRLTADEIQQDPEDARRQSAMSRITSLFGRR